MSTSTSTCPANDVTLRQATEDDARNMAIIKMSNTSVFSRVIDNLPEMTAGSVPEATIQAHERDIRKRLSTKNALVTVAIVPTSDNGEEIAGWAMWKISDEPQPIEEEPKPVTSEHDDEQARLAKFCLQDFKSALAKYRNIYTAGKRNVRLCNLFTHPAFHRRGIGSRLIKQGTDLADQKGYIAFLEASPMGKALYEKHGFEQVDSFTLDMARYTSSAEKEDMQLYTTSIMIRQPSRQ
ncbi:acyl-CoA N-acyltransferase [Cystobasidium minutum MCA 4210]|uniref:acyl-CoA N-acyltransferase n=1 Tax=Cystobasidium minutum MCA 4210 TaxID=1397322 RepID=UPI0034CF844E|eukprot:jgi/Rhomi1/196507/gm1.4721_g